MILTLRKCSVFYMYVVFLTYEEEALLYIPLVLTICLEIVYFLLKTIYVNGFDNVINCIYKHYWTKSEITLSIFMRIRALYR